MSTMEQRTMKSGWELTTLGKVCTVDWGNTELTKSAYVNGGKFLAVSAAGCDGRIEHKEHEKYTPVLSAIGAQCGRMFFPEEDFTAIKNTITLTPNFGRCTGRFLYQLLTHVDLPKRGTAQPFISKGDIQSFQIPLPPLAEQQRIVAILDEAFEGIATARKHAEQNLQNAKALFESHLEAVFSQKGEGWVERSLDEIALNFGRGKSKHRPRNDPKLYGGIYPFIQTGDIRNSDHFITEYTQTYSEAGLAQSKLWPMGTICITIAANIAETAILGFDACFPDSVIGIVANPDFATVGFIEYLLQSFKGRIQALGKGSAQANINLGTFEHERFPFPPIFEQNKIVSQLDALRDETNRLCDIYSQKIAALDALKKSLLHQAFSGEL